MSSLSCNQTKYVIVKWELKLPNDTLLPLSTSAPVWLPSSHPTPKLRLYLEVSHVEEIGCETQCECVRLQDQFCLQKKKQVYPSFYLNAKNKLSDLYELSQPVRLKS